MADDTGATGSASAAGSSPASPAASATPASSTPASATATPAGSPPAAATPAPEYGPVPYERFKSVNDQLKTAREFQEQHGWAAQFRTDPYTFVDSWVDQLAQHPEYSPKILAKAARLLQSRRGTTPAAPTEEPAPDIPITDAHGNPTGQFTYSANQLKQWRAWDWAQKETAFSERLAPLEQRASREAQREQVAQIERQSQDHARTTLTELRQSPHFTQHEPAIKQALINHPEWGADVHRAYAHVLTTTVIPGLTQREQAKVLDHLKTQAAGASVHPGSASASGPPKFKSFGDAARYYADHPDEAGAMAER